MTEVLSPQETLLASVRRIYDKEKGVTWYPSANSWDSVTWPIGVKLGTPYDAFSNNFVSATLWVYGESSAAFTVSRNMPPFNLRAHDRAIADLFFTYVDEHDHSECEKFRDSQLALGGMALDIDPVDYLAPEFTD